jgi:osmotically-inducible protein OsmY
MKTNSELQKDVQDAIKWEPLLNAAEIGVTVKDGVVSLTGIVDCYAKKIEAENAAKKVVGVKALVENIKIKFPNSWLKTDAEVANEVLAALNSNLMIPDERLKVSVEEGWVTLEGNLPWNYQRVAAKNAVHLLMGVKGVTNNIKIKSERRDAIEQIDVENALARSLSLDARDIKVEVKGTTVTLMGTVNSWYQKTEEFINLQRKRYKIEAKNSELKNVLGYDRALSYGLSCMEMQGALTIFAANVKRIIKLMQNA